MTRRGLRLGSGRVRFSYLSVHFVGHALGLVSLAAAERALSLAVGIWHSGPGTVVLAGAAAAHLALAFIAVYERRTLRMPPVQALRIALGFGMPLLVIGHVVATRIAADRYGLSPTYSRIVWALWMSDGEGRQLALLAPGWVHGCLGLDLALGRRRIWQRLRPVLFGAAVLLPVLAGLGFLAMGRELAVLALDPALRPGLQTLSPAHAVGLGRLRDGLLGLYFALIAGVFVAREVRAQVERRRRQVVAIRYPNRRVEVPRGWTVLEASRSFGIPHLSQCGGRARCSTCRVRVVAGAAQCPLPAPDERQTLDRIHADADVRLACQLRPVADIAVVPLLEAGKTARQRGDGGEPAAERVLALLLVRLDAWEASAPAQHTSHDIVYAINRFLAVAGSAIDRNGGSHGHFDGNGASALFGHATDLGTACRSAWRAAAEIERELDSLNLRLQQEVGVRAAFTIAVHAGPVVIGDLGHGRERAPAAVGDAVFTARALCARATREGMRFAASRAAAVAAGVCDDGITWRTVEVGAGSAPVEAALEGHVFGAG